MPKVYVDRGATSRIYHVFIQDSSVTTGAGLAGLAFGSAGFTAAYIRPGEAAATVLNLETIAALGTWVAPTSAAHLRFLEIDAVNMPGWYEVQVPDALLDTTGTRKSIGIILKGATNQAPCNLEIQLIGAAVFGTILSGATIGVC
jgi:hypothetical protein